ncbi:MAG: UDP-3-O-(3-hydroxymyristoyl)glucosamine N-acyltransferase [Tepidisphaeraceae bacterium]
MTTLAQVAALLGVSPGAGAERPVRGISSLADAEADQIAFLTDEKSLPELPGCRACAVVVSNKLQIAEAPVPLLPVENADAAMVKLLHHFAPSVPRPAKVIDSSARVASTASIHDGCAIGPFVAIGERAKISSNCVLHAGVFIGDDVVLGEDCTLFPNVVVRERVQIGSRVIIHAGAVLGTDGFGYYWDNSRHQKIPQIGTVIVEDDVEIGSCACIDRAKFAATVIGRGTKIDNLVQVGHNVRIGPHCILAGQAGLAGSTTLGTGVVMGGQSGAKDHLHIGDGTILAACSAIHEDSPPHSILSGMPAIPHRESIKMFLAQRRLPELVGRVKQLEQELAELKKLTAGKPE